MYLQFSEYQMMGGTAQEPAFNRLSFRADKIIDRFTQNRVAAMASVPESVKRCIVELVEAMTAADPTKTAVTPSLTGFSNDGYSESYSAPATTEGLETVYYAVIKDYLSAEKDDRGIPLLYAGVDQ